jgi:hypothetical protein
MASCVSAIERYVWDGSDLVQEIRYPGRHGIPEDSLEVDNGFVYQIFDRRLRPEDPEQIDTVYSPHYGTTTCTHAGVIDRPLLIERMWYGQDTIKLGTVTALLHYDANGAVDEGTAVSGSVSGVALAGQGYWVYWPAADIRVYGDRRSNGRPPSWFGELIDGMRDASGLQ